MTELKKGTLVRVYQKPMTDEDEEGVARILTMYDEYDEVMGVLCDVRFAGETEPVMRRIYRRNIVTRVTP